MKKTKAVFIVMGILVFGFCVWEITALLVKSSYSSKDYVEKKAVEGYKDLTEESSTAGDTVYEPILRQENVSDDAILSFIDSTSSREDAIDYVGEAIGIKSNQKGNSYATSTITDSDGIEVPVGSNGRPVYEGTKTDLLIVYSYELLKGIVNLENSTYVEGIYDSESINNMICINIGGDTDLSNDIVVVGDSGGYPKMYCRQTEYTLQESEVFMNENYSLVPKNGYYMFCR